MAGPTNTAIMAELIKLGGEVARLSDAIGAPNDKADGGTGLTGEVLRVKTTVAGLASLKNQGVGALAALALVSSLLVLGVKQWLTNLLGGAA